MPSPPKSKKPVPVFKAGHGLGIHASPKGEHEAAIDAAAKRRRYL